MARRKAPSPEAAEAAQIAVEAAQRIREAEAARLAAEDARLVAEAARRVEEEAARQRAAEAERRAAEEAAILALALRAEADADIARSEAQISVLEKRVAECARAYEKHITRERQDDPPLPADAPEDLSDKLEALKVAMEASLQLIGEEISAKEAREVALRPGWPLAAAGLSLVPGGLALWRLCRVKHISATRSAHDAVVKKQGDARKTASKATSDYARARLRWAKEVRLDLGARRDALRSDRDVLRGRVALLTLHPEFVRRSEAEIRLAILCMPKPTGDGDEGDGTPPVETTKP